MTSYVKIMGKKLYVQVSYLLASEETIQREFGAFAGVRDNFPKYVVTMDELDMLSENRQPFSHGRYGKHDS